MGQANSKQEAGAVSDENRLLYPIGGGHVGEGPVYVNPIAEGSQQQIPTSQEKPGTLQSAAAGGPAAISNPVYEDESNPTSSASPAEAPGTANASSATAEPGLTKSAKAAPSSTAVETPAAESTKGPQATPSTPVTAAPAAELSKGATAPEISPANGTPAAEESTVPAGSASSPVREKAGGEAVVAPKTPESVVPPPATAKHGPLYSSMPTYIRLGSEEPNQSVANGETAGAAPGLTTTTTHSSSSQHQESSSSSSHQIIGGSTLPELKTEQPLQADNSLDRPPAPPNTPLVPNTSEITADEGPADTSMPPGKSIKGGLSSSERGISKAALASSKDYEKPVAGPSSAPEPAPKAAAVESPSPAVEEPAPAVEKAAPAAEEPAPAVEKAIPAVATTTATPPIKSRPLTETPAPATAAKEIAPVAATAPGGVKKMGNTGSLVSQEDKIQPGGCLCLSAPGTKKGKKGADTIGTDAPIYTGPATTGVAIGGGSLYDAKAAEPETVVATSTASPKPEVVDETALKSGTATESLPPAEQEEKLTPEATETVSKAADPNSAGALSTTSPEVPTKIDPPATAEPVEAEPATAEGTTTTSGDGVESGSRAVPIPVPVAIPTSDAQHHKNLSKEEAAVLPPLQETSTIQQSSPGSTTVAGGVVALPAEGTTSRAAPVAEEPAAAAAAAEPSSAEESVLPKDAAAVHQKETAPGYEEGAAGAISTAVGVTEGPSAAQTGAPSSLEPKEAAAAPEATVPAVASPEASALKAPESETAASGAAIAAPLSTKPLPKKQVSFKEDQLPPAEPAAAAEAPAVAEKEAVPHVASTAEATPATATTHSAEQTAIPDSVLLTPIQETNLTKSGAGLEEEPPADAGYLSSTDISEMPGIGRSVPATPETEAGSVLVGGTEQPKALTLPEEQIIDSQEQASPLSQIQRDHERAEDRELPSSSTTALGVAGSSQAPAATSAKSPITSEGAAEEATGSALAAGASAGAGNAAAAAPVGKQPSARQSRKLEKQASKREADARATAQKEKFKADKQRFKEKRKEERAHKKEQAKRMQQERQQAGTTPGGGKTTVGVFGFLSRPKKEGKKEDEEKKSVTPESQAVGDAAIGAGPSQAGRSAAGAGISGPANALGATGTSRSDLGASADPSGIETGSNASGYLASQGIGTEGGSGRAPEGTPEVIALEDMPATNEGPSTAVAPTDTTAKAPATPVQVEETAPRAEPEGEIAPLPVSTPEPVASSSRAVEEPASPQNVAVVFAASHAAGEAAPYAAEESTPTKEAEAPVQAPVTPPQGEVTEDTPTAEDTAAAEDAAAANVLAAVTPKKKEKKPKVKKVKTKSNIDYSAIHMQKIPESKIRDGFNPATGQYDTTQGKRVAPGAFSPLRTNQPVVQQSAKLAKQDTLQRKKSRKMDANAVTPLLTSRTMAPAGRGIERPEASANKADYRPLSRSFA